MSKPRTRNTLGAHFSGRANSMGFLRLAMALAVVVSHASPLGFNRIGPGEYYFGHQIHLGILAVYGFFVMSGFLITRSAMRVGIGRYAWHRILRIFPGLWVCLLLVALVGAPLASLYLHHTTAGYWRAANGPWSYLVGNAEGVLRQQGISGLVLTGTQWGGLVNGSLWTLMYELFCYFGVALLAVTGLLKRAPWAVASLAASCWLFVVASYIVTGRWSGPFPGARVVTVVKSFDTGDLVPLALVFLVGATALLYASRIPIDGRLACVCAALLGGSLCFGAFFAIGLPAFAYLMLWLAVRLPEVLRRVGRSNDYSYGIYIYAWPVQQGLAMVGLNRWGVLPFMLLSIAGAFALAIPSWHLVEHRALRLKDWDPRRARAT